MKRNILLSMALVFGICGEAIGQVGALDSSFGQGGKVTSEFSQGYNDLKSAALQLDGKIVLAGYATTTEGFENTKLILMRLNEDGSLDDSFGEDGVLNTGLVGENLGFFASEHILAIQPTDGKILVFNDESDGFSLVRYDINGVLDNGFGFNGIVTNSGFEPQAIAVQTDSKILIAGALNGDYALLRFMPDGTLDNGFGANGLVTTDLGFDGEFANLIALHPDGRIVLSGYHYDNTSQLALVRYLENGTLDSTFSEDGILPAIAPYSTNSLVVHGDDKILVSSYIFFFQFNQDGTPDADFGTNGTVQTWSDGIETFNVQQDGKIMALTVDWDNVTKLERYNPDGSPDNSFYISWENGTTHLLFQPDEKLIMAGNSKQNNMDFALMLLDTNLNVDNSFGIDGRVVINLGKSIEAATALAVQPDGRLVVAGSCENGYALARYGNDGNLDNSFGGNGLATGNISPEIYFIFGQSWIANSIGIQSDGKIMVGGIHTEPEFPHDVFTTLVSFDGTMNDYLWSSNGDEIATQENGKFLMTGFLKSDSDFSDAFLWRLEEGGMPDSSFGANGKVTITEGMALNPIPAITPGNKIMVGIIYGFGNFDVGNVALLRYNENGNLDSTFATNGMLITDLLESRINSLIVQPDGKILLAASVIARFNSDGTPDTSFGTDGIVTPGFPTHIALQSDGKILATGTDNDDFALLCFFEDGTPDNDFGQNGWVVTDFDGAVDKANAITIQPDGKIVVAGESDGDFAIARYLSGLETSVFEKPESKVSIIDLAPNPATDLLYLELPATAKPARFDIFDAQGRLVQTGAFAEGENLQVGQLPGGVFTLKMTDGERMYVGRFVKQ